mmetsp:Transcript_5270/g.3991  ORF Transcript_5270/g.3991 Transcript_5270/m.3991 type:complete len:102 (-) Transcript_5270:735-1040(-)
MEDPSVITGKIFEKFPLIKRSPIYEALNKMPKPAILHLHDLAFAPIDDLIKLTYNDFVYYNDKLKLLRVRKGDFNEEGFIKTSTLRKHWGIPANFDNYLKK